MKLPVILFLAAVLAGGWFGRSTAPATTDASPPRSRSASKIEPRWSTGDIQSRALEVVQRFQQPGHDPYAELLADWSDDEIRAALDAGLKDPEYVLEGGSGGSTMDALFGEWMKRDLDAALVWFDAIGIESARNRMAAGLSYRWPAEHAERGLEFLIAHKNIFISGSPWSILVKNFEARARSGPEALGRLLERINKEGLSLEFGNPAQLPAGFDYSAFVTTAGFGLTKDEPAVSGLLSGWMTEDRDAAFDWFFENRGAAGLFNLMPREREGGREAVLDNWEWLGTKVGTLDEAGRTELLDALKPGWWRDHQAGARFAAGIDDRALREEIHEAGARVILSGSVAPAIRSLEQIEDPARRIEILSAMNRSDDPLAGGFRQPISEADSALLREKLAEWQASETQVDQILRQLQP